MQSIAQLVETLAVQTRNGDLYGDSLLHQLREARFASTGATRFGVTAPAETVPLNMGALSTWENVTGQIAVEYAAGVDEPQRGIHRLPELYVLKWATAILSTIARHEETADVEASLTAITVLKLSSWISEIENTLRPIVGSIREACPRCGEDVIIIGEGELRAQVNVLARTSRPGEPLTITCRQCGASWVGDQQVILLGRLTGQTLDVDAIREARSVQPDPNLEMKWHRFERFDPTNPNHIALVKTVA